MDKKIILNPNCSEYVSTIITTKDRTYKGKDKYVHFVRKDNTIEYHIDYEDFSFKELLAMARAMLWFAKEIRIHTFYRPMNKPVITHMDFTAYIGEIAYQPKIKKLVIHKMNDHFKEQVKHFRAGLFPIYHRKRHLKGQSLKSFQDDLIKKCKLRKWRPSSLKVKKTK